MTATLRGVRRSDIDAVLDGMFPGIRTTVPAMFWRAPRIRWATWTDRTGRVGVVLEGRPRLVHRAAWLLLCRFPLDEGPLRRHGNRIEWVLIPCNTKEHQ